MGADTTLVTAAFKHGESLAGAEFPDMSPQIEGQREISKTYVSGVLDIFKSLKEDEEELDNLRDAQLRAFKVAAAKAKKHLLDNEQAQPMKVHDAIYDKFKSLEQEFMLYNTVEENDTEENEKMRANLYAQLSVISNQAVEARGTIATKATMADFIVGDGGPEHVQNIAIGRAIMGVDGNYENIELSFNEKGQLVYHVLLKGMNKPVSWTIEDFNKNIIIHDVKIDAYAQTRQNEAYRRGHKTEQDFNYDEEKSNYLKTVIKNDEQIFRDIAFSEINGKKSWKKSLLENPEIATASIEYLFTENMVGKLGLADVDGIGGVTFADMDRDGDNKITSADLNNLSDDAKLLWKQNIQLITDALTNVKNPAFDFGKSADALADYFVSGLEKDYFDDGRGHQDPGVSNLTIPQQAERARAIKIDQLVNQDDISLIEINSIITGTNTNPLKVYRGRTDKKTGDWVRDDENGNQYSVQMVGGKGDTVEYMRFDVNDKRSLRSALYNYSYTDPFYGNQNFKFTSSAPILETEQKKAFINPPPEMVREAEMQGRDVVWDKDYGWRIK